MASSQKQHYEHGLKNSSFKTFRTTFEPFRKRKIQSGNLKISLSSELGAVSDREISDVRQKMKAVHQESVKIAQVKRSRLHSILFDNTGNKTDKKQILGVILDTCSHFIRKRSRNSRYITFSSNLNESRSFNQNESYETCISEGSDSRFSGFRFKKINISFAALLVFAMCFFVSCGGDSVKSLKSGDSVSNFGKLGGECYPNETCDKGLLCDTANNICIEDPENPTDESDKPDGQNNQNDQDNHWEQPDENGQENLNDQDTPSEQPDQDIPDEHDDTDTSGEQPDQDTPNGHDDTDTADEQPDQDIPIDQGDVCHGEGCQGNRGCKPGYFWTEYASNYVYTGGDPDYHCVACIDGGTSFVDNLRGANYYCPGGDNLKGTNRYNQIEKCPQYAHPNANFDTCVCRDGLPPPEGKECTAGTLRKKPLIINSSLK